MEQKKNISNEIEALKSERANIKGTTTEVYTRIVGYYRSVKNWNKGKREEFNHRITFALSNPERGMENPHHEEQKKSQGDLFSAPDSADNYIYFYRKTCPNCPPVKELLSRLPLQGIEIDVDSVNGLEKAREWEVMASPTVILLDTDGREINRSTNAGMLKECIPAELLLKEEVILGV